MRNVTIGMCMLDLAPLVTEVVEVLTKPLPGGLVPPLVVGSFDRRIVCDFG